MITNKSQLPSAVCFVAAECRPEANLMSLYVLAAFYLSHPKMITYLERPCGNQHHLFAIFLPYADFGSS